MTDRSVNPGERLRLLAICNYPSDTRPALQVFVRALLLELAGLGVDVTVIAPESYSNLAKRGSKFSLAPARETRDDIPVHRPRHVTLSRFPLPFGLHTARLSARSYVRAVSREVERIGGTYDVCLGHFLYPHALAAAEVGSGLGIPAVASLGESSFDRYTSVYEAKEIAQLLGRFTGVVSNSTLIKDDCVREYGLAEEKVRVFPNGVNEKRFMRMDQGAARRRLGLPPDRPIVISVGQFIERKGPLRILEAIQTRPEVGAVFLGYGPQVPTGPQVLFQGSVRHEDVPVWLNAADAFVLPTLDEGCSNAILEAISCGLPVVSSDLPFNQNILNDSVAVLVDPLDVGAIGDAIFSLIDDPPRMQRMKESALEHAQSFRLQDRARRILSFLRECVEGFHLAMSA